MIADHAWESTNQLSPICLANSIYGCV